MARRKNANVRQIIINDLKKDLFGPALGENEVLRERPNIKYITGILFPKNNQLDIEEVVDLKGPFSKPSESNSGEEVEFNEDDVPETKGGSGDNESEDEIKQKKFKFPSTMGLSFYLESHDQKVAISVNWGKYVEKSEQKEDGNEYPLWTRIPQSLTLSLDLAEIDIKNIRCRKIFT